MNLFLVNYPHKAQKEHKNRGSMFKQQALVLFNNIKQHTKTMLAF